MSAPAAPLPFRMVAVLTLKVTTGVETPRVALPYEAMQRLDVRDGDIVVLTELPEGGYRLSRSNPDFARQMALAEAVMQQDREILSALAK